MRSFCLLLFLASSILVLAGCRENQTKPGVKKAAKPHIQPIVIKVLPLGPVDKGKIEAAVTALEKFAGPVILLKPQDLPKHAYYPPRKRYRADKLIQWMAGQAKRGEVYVGLTASDISATKGTVDDFGVMGLGYRPGRACVISSFRLRNKANFYKVVLHEVAHTAGLPHCPEKTCFLRDAKGGDPTGEETGFCPACEKFLQGKGWKFALKNG
jgi:archaemetzincin